MPTTDIEASVSIGPFTTQTFIQPTPPLITVNSYESVLSVWFPTLNRTINSRILAGDNTEDRFVKFSEGGLGTISIDLDETSHTIRLGNASFAFVNVGSYRDTFEDQPLINLPCLVVLDTGGYEYILFDGFVDRAEVTRERISISAIAKMRNDLQSTTVTVRQVIAAYRADHSGALPFPNIPPASLDAILPLYLIGLVNPAGVRSAPLIPMGNSCYLVGAGASVVVTAVRDKGESIPAQLPFRPIIYNGTIGMPYILVKGMHIPVIKLNYKVDNDNDITADVNQVFEPAEHVGTSVATAWSHLNAISGYDNEPLPRQNYFDAGSIHTGSFEPGDLAGWSWTSADGVAEVVTFAGGSGKVHQGFRSVRLRSTNLTDTGEHRWSGTFQKTITVPTGSAATVSFWYIAGTFLAAGDPPDQQVSNQLTVQINSDPEILLQGSPGFEQMAEYKTTVIAAGGSVTVILRGAGLTEEKSADVYLDDFVCTIQQPGATYLDSGLPPWEGIIQVLANATPPGDPILYDPPSLNHAKLVRVGWKIRSRIENPPTVFALVQKIASQMNAVLLKTTYGPLQHRYYEVRLLDEAKSPRVDFDSDLIERSTVTRVSSPADTIFTQFYVDYAEGPGQMYLTQDDSNMPSPSALMTECADRVALRGGENPLHAESDLILDQFTATAYLHLLFNRYGFQGDTVAWRTKLDAIDLKILDQVTLTSDVLPFGDTVQAEIIGWHFLPPTMEIELVARTLPDVLTPPDPTALIIAADILLFTTTGVSVGVSMLTYIIHGPDVELDLGTLTPGTLTPSDAGSFTLSTEGFLVFTPATTFSGLASAPYSVQDMAHTHTSNTALIVITVGEGAQYVVANPDEVSTPVNEPITFNALDNDTAIDPQVLDIATVDLDPNTTGRQTTFTDTGKGDYSVDDSGNVTFTPDTDFEGASRIFYLVKDEAGHSSNISQIRVIMGSNARMSVFTVVTEIEPSGGETPTYEWAFLYAATGDPPTTGAWGVGSFSTDMYFCSGWDESGLDLVDVHSHRRIFGNNGAASTLIDLSGTVLLGVRSSDADIVATFYWGVLSYSGTPFLAEPDVTIYASTDQRDAPAALLDSGTVLYGTEPNTNGGIGTVGVPLILELVSGTMHTRHTFDSTYFAVSCLVKFGSTYYAGLSRTGGDDVEIWSSSDKATWTLAATIVGVDTISAFCVFGSNLYAAVYTAGSARHVYSTPDGTTWTSVESFSTSSNQILTSLVTDGTILVLGMGSTDLGTQECRVYTSPDGTTWTLSVDFASSPFSDINVSVTAIAYVPSISGFSAMVGSRSETPGGEDVANVYTLTPV